jgi:hypothetical protein
MARRLPASAFLHPATASAATDGIGARDQRALQQGHPRRIPPASAISPC